jgi:DNA polymerase-3 subunit beta
VEAVVSQAGSILVPLARLLDIVRTFPKTADISFQALDQGGAKITCERAKFTLVAPEFNSFPELPKTNEGEIEIQADTIASMIASTIFAITQEESRYTLSGAKLEIDQSGLRMVTTDGHRLAKSEVNTTTAKNPLGVLIPKKALAALKKICAAHDGPLKLATDENHAYFHVGSRILTARLLFGQFPNYEMVIPKDNNQSFTTNAALFRETLRRVSLMADERSHAVRLDIKTNSLRFHASHRDEGEAVEDLPIALETAPAAAGTTEKHNTLSIGINCEYLLDALGSITSEQATMSFKDQNSQIMIFPATPTPIQVSNVVMPMRI